MGVTLPRYDLGRKGSLGIKEAFGQVLKGLTPPVFLV